VHTVRVFRPGRSQMNAQWILSSPLSDKEYAVLKLLCHWLSYSKSRSLCHPSQMERLVHKFPQPPYLFLRSPEARRKKLSCTFSMWISTECDAKGKRFALLGREVQMQK
jgi:hypothetical protein